MTAKINTKSQFFYTVNLLDSVNPIVHLYIKYDLYI